MTKLPPIGSGSNRVVSNGGSSASSNGSSHLRERERGFATNFRHADKNNTAEVKKKKRQNQKITRKNIHILTCRC